MTMLVATHKAAALPADPFYLPVHVGHAVDPVDLGYQPDDVGDNISALNKSYCELTAVYWAWRNLDADIVGLSHYRRYFRGTAEGPHGARIMSAANAEGLLAANDIVVGRRRHYVVETIESHYRNAHHGEDLDVLRDVVGELAPDFVAGYDRVFAGRSLSLYNMFLTRRETFDRYASWLFAILEETGQRVDVHPDRTAYQRRTMGYLGERLLNVWLAGQPDLRVAREPIVNVEREPKVTKGIKMLARKAGVIDATARET
jgi:hypothetical protein